MKGSRHRKKVAALDQHDAANATLLRAVKRQQELVVADDAKRHRPNVAAEATAARIGTVRMLLRLGVPLVKTRDAEFLARLQGEGPSLGGYEGLREVLPWLHEQQVDQLRKFLSGRKHAFIFDGTKVNRHIEVQLVRAVSDTGDIEERCAGLTAVTRSMSGLQLKGLLSAQRTRLAVNNALTVADHGDSAATNLKCVELWNEEIASLPTLTERLASSMFYNRCLGHMCTNTGLELKKVCPELKTFVSGFKGLAVSATAAQLWRDIVGTAMPKGTDNRWWSWWERNKVLLLNHNHLISFVVALRKQAVMPKKTAKMDSALNKSAVDRFTLLLQMQLVDVLGADLVKVLCGSPCDFSPLLFQGTYMLENAGMTAPFTYEVINTINTFFCAVAPAGSIYERQFFEFGETVGKGVFHTTRMERIAQVWKLRFAITKYWEATIMKGMQSEIQLFEGFTVLNPLLLTTMSDQVLFDRLKLLVAEEHMESGICRTVTGCKGFTNEHRAALMPELVRYKQLAAQYAPTLQQEEPSSRPKALWAWWWSIAKDVPQWYDLAHSAVLHQPTSTSVERFFSKLKAASLEQQWAEHDETMECRAFCLINNL